MGVGGPGWRVWQRAGELRHFIVKDGTVLNSSRSTRLGLTVLLCGGLTVVAGTLAFAKAPWAFQTKPAAAQPGIARSTLNFPLGTRWDKVLNGFAAEHGLTMVMDRIPTGTFKRLDRREYALTASLNILNEELAQQDFRLILQRDFLVLLHLRETRTRYRRPHLPATTRPIATSTQSLPIPVAGSGIRSESHTIRPRSWQPPQPLQPSPADTGQPIQRVQLENPIESKLIRTPLVPKHRTALALARRLYTAFLSHSELLDSGPSGLPAFRVMDRATKSEDGKLLVLSDSDSRVTRFSVGIDSKNNQLVIEAPKSTTSAVVRMIRLLDVIEASEQPEIQVRESQQDAEAVASKVRPVIRDLVAATLASAKATGRSLLQDRKPQKPTEKQPPKNPLQTESDSQPRPATVKPDAGDAADAADSKAADSDMPFSPTEAILGGLRGEVKIEVLPDGRLVVIGNQEDVDKVMTLIDLLERYGAPTVPELELITLEHVNSEALAALLTSVYGTLNTARTQAGQRSQTVTVVPLVKPNAILILAPGGDLQSIVDLAIELDRPVDPLTEFEVFRLKHAPAGQVATMLEDIYEEGEDREGLATRVVVYPDVRTNSIVVQARPRDLKEVAALVKRIDLDSANSVNQLRVFQLKHAIAEELSETINVAIQSVINPARLPAGSGVGGFGGGGAGGAQAAQQLRDVRSAVLELLPEAGSKEMKVVSGILSDIRINPDARTNSLVVTAPERSMKMMQRLIEKLDKPTSVVADIKHFLLENADASSVAELLTELFVTDETGGGTQLGVQLAGAEDASSSIVPLRFSVDVRTNSIFAVGGREALEVVEAVVVRVDQSDIRQRKSEVYLLQNQPATEIAAAVNAFLQSQRDLQQIDPDLVSPFEQIEREVIVVAEPSTNSLIVSATPRYYDEVMKMITALDRPLEQVTVHALIVEVELNSSDEFGIELGFQDSVLFDRGTVATIETLSQTNQASGNNLTTTENIVSSEGVPGFNFNQPFLGNNTLGTLSAPALVGKQALSNFQMGRVNGDLGFGGLVLSAGSESINILLRALSENRRVEVLSRPMVQALHNQTGLIHVGQTFQQVNGVSSANALTGVTQPNLEERAVGIQLTVTPRVSPDGTIVMEVVATKDQISPNNSVPIFADPVTGTTFDSPVIDTATAQASVSVRDGQTIVLAGMITRTEGTTERKVPWLADLPLLGAVFRYDSHTLRRTELLIFLTPRIMKTPADYEEQKQVEAERMSFSIERAEAIHGPLFSMPKPSAGDGETKTTSPTDAPSESKKPEPKASGTDSGDATDKDPSASLSAPGNTISPASISVVGRDDPDARIFALPNTVDGFEASEPVRTSPVKRFFKSLLP
jgi:type II secretory pathway component GspD/PulD (secretin)